MRAVTVREKQLSVEDHPDPEPGAGEVLVRVRAAGLNGADMLQRRGLYPAPPGPAPVRNADLHDQVAKLGARPIAPDGFGDHGPFDVILELVGAPNLRDNLAALNTQGRITVIGIGAGATAELNLGMLMAKRGRI